MTDTPNERTLKIALEIFTELANTLKQERDEAREAIRALAEHGESEIQRITKERDKWAELCGQYKQERDEVRRQNEVCRGIIERTVTARNSALSELTELELERDEAREALRQIWQSGDAFLPYIDKETTNRWRKAAGWEETK